MLEELKNNDLIITNNKKSILKYLTDNKKLLNLKIMSLSEFKDKYFGYYNEEAIYYLVNKYNYKYNVAKLYLDNYLFMDDLKEELIKNNLIKKEPLFKNSIKRIVNFDVEIDPFIQKEIDKFEFIKISSKNNNFTHAVYEFKTLEDEVNFVCQEILKLLKTIDINKIFLVNIKEEYETTLKRLFNFYNIPINLNGKKNIYGTISVKKFLDSLKETKSLEKSLEELPKDLVYDAIVNVCNKYAFRSIDDTIIYLIEENLKDTSLENEKLDNAVNIADINELDNNNYYFILGFNEGVLPKIYKDEDYLSDTQKSELGILTSFDKNKIEKNKIKNILSNYNNLTISYKLKSYKEDYYPSSLISDLSLQVINNYEFSYNHSNMYNKITLAKKIDNLIKYNIKDDTLSTLYSNYKIPYLDYDNTYKKIDNDLFLNYINNELLLSYSSIDNYYRCSFRYYLSNILKLDKYEETFNTFIGNLFHYILSIAFNPDFDFEYEFNNYINKTLTHKEKFYINKLKKDLLFIIDTIKEQDNYSSLNNSLYEQKIFVDKSKNIKITFMGIIDKLKYESIDNKTIVAIIDYKTGSPDINLNNIYYGISMQLPIYLYLANNSSLENVEIAGIYLQKLIHNKLNYEQNKNYDEEVKKLYKLEGYSNSDEAILSLFDKSYNDSNVIKSMKTTKNGFYAYSKVLNKEQINNINTLVENKIDEAITNILDTNFKVNPKRIDDELKGCEFCKFKDICYVKEENIVSLKSINYKDFLGGDTNA